MFKEDLAEAVSLRLDRGMEAVNVAVPRERSAGCEIQLGEYVNVNLTSRITDGDGKQSIRTRRYCPRLPRDYEEKQFVATIEVRSRRPDSFYFGSQSLPCSALSISPSTKAS